VNDSGQVAPALTGQAGLRPLSERAGVHVCVLIAISGALFFLRAPSLPLLDTEEARCALIVREMVRSGNYLQPTLDGEAYYDKPAPFFWLAALAEKATGNPELAGRLVSGLFGILAVLITYSVACRLGGPVAGLLAGLVVATSGQVLFMARWYRMDMPFAAAMWAAIWWFLRSEAPVRRRTGDTMRMQWVGFYFFCAIATLFKGPGGLVVPGLVVGAYLLLAGKPRRVLEFFSPFGLAVYLLVAGQYFLMACLHDHQYFSEFFIKQNIGRYSEHTFRGFPGILYVPILLAGLLPWTIFLPGVIVRMFPRRWRLRNADPGLLMLWLAALVPLAFFSFSATKLAGYILPCFPPLAALTGLFLARWAQSDQPDRLMAHGARALIITAAVMAVLPVAPEVWLRRLDAWIALPILAGAALVWLMLVALRRGKRLAFLIWGMAAVAASFLFLIGHTAEGVYDLHSTRVLARATDPKDAWIAKYYFVADTRLSFLYYTDRAVTKLTYDPRRWWDEAGQAFLSDQPVYCLVVGDENMANLRKQINDEKAQRHLPTTPGQCPELVILKRSGDRWLVTNRRGGG
jgi:4-amino-4-deoxy-L-arabinose transferase-like glycosyltransferase